MSEQCTGLSLNVSLSKSPVAWSKITVLIAKTTDVFDLAVRLRHFINFTSMDNQQETEDSQCSICIYKGIERRTIFRVGKGGLNVCVQKQFYKRKQNLLPNNPGNSCDEAHYCVTLCHQTL